MSLIRVDEDRCKRDGACLLVCPTSGITKDENGYPVASPDANCLHCGYCVAVCGCGALIHTELHSQESFRDFGKVPEIFEIDVFLHRGNSIRRFKAKSLSQATLSEVLSVAKRAPTLSREQKLHWVVASDAERVKTISAEAIRWLREAGVAPSTVNKWDSGEDLILRSAPAAVFVYTSEAYEAGCQDAAIALSFIDLAAEVRGLATNWVGALTRIALHHEPLRRVLGLPEGCILQGGVALGFEKHAYRRILPQEQMSVQWL